MTRTPIVDGALDDPMAVPSGLDVQLRLIETRAWDLVGRASEIPRTAALTEGMVEALAGLERFLHDPVGSPFYRLLRRPLFQLQPDGPAFRSFRRYADHLFERLAEAIEVQSGVDGLRGRLSSIEDRYSSTYPRLWARFREAARLGTADLQKVRSASTTRTLESRCDRFETMLKRLESVTPPHASVAQIAGGATIPELQGLLELRLRRRRLFAFHGSTVAMLRLQSANHLAALGEAAMQTSGASTTASEVARLILNRVVGTDKVHRDSVDDVALWEAALSGAERRLWSESEGWNVYITSGNVEPIPAAGGTTVHFAVAIDDEYVLLTQSVATCVRVWSRGIRKGETVECRIFGTETVPLGLAQLDVSPLFEGVTDSAKWYRTGKRAVVEVLEQVGDDFIGRLKFPGRVRALPHGAASSDSPEAGSVRILPAISPVSRGEPAKVESLRGSSFSFGGVVTAMVRAPLAEASVAWLRRAENIEDIYLENEQRFFLKLHLKDSRLALRPLGGGELPDGQRGRLYEPPLGIRLPGSPPLIRWASESPHCFVQALCQAFVAINELGYALRTYHTNAFAFGVVLRNHSLSPVPILVHAAQCVELGKSLNGRTEISAGQIEYTRLRFRGIPPPQDPEGCASPRDDACGVGLALLEILARRSLRAFGWNSWDELLSVVPQKVDHFALPNIAEAIASLLTSEAGQYELLRYFKVLGSEGGDSLVSIVDSIA